MLPLLNEKEQQIINFLIQDPTISVSDLAENLSVSAVTMRSYLNGLAEKGYLYRVHGGAVPTIHPAIVERDHQLQAEKRAIARTAAEMVRDGDTIMIEAGTTTAMIVRFLLGRRDVSVITNNTLALAHTRGNPGLRVHMVGGEFRPATESVVGPMALSFLERFHVRTAFVGTDGLSVDKGLTTHLVEGAEIVIRMAQQADRTVAVADSSKFNREGFVRVLPLQKLDTIITDSAIGPAAASAIRKLGIELITVAPE